MQEVCVIDEFAWKEKQRGHAIRRAKERYGLDVTPDIDAIAELIRTKNGLYCCTHKRNTRFEVWVVVIKKTKYLIGWDKIHKTIATFLPPDNIPYYEERGHKVEAAKRKRLEAQKARLEQHRAEKKAKPPVLINQEYKPHDCDICGEAFARHELKGKKVKLVCVPCQNTLGTFKSYTQKRDPVRLLQHLIAEVTGEEECEPIELIDNKFVAELTPGLLGRMLRWIRR